MDKASGREGVYRSVSMALIVCRETPRAVPSWPWESPRDDRSSLTLFRMCKAYLSSLGGCQACFTGGGAHTEPRARYSPCWWPARYGRASAALTAPWKATTPPASVSPDLRWCHFSSAPSGAWPHCVTTPTGVRTEQPPARHRVRTTPARRCSYRCPPVGSASRGPAFRTSPRQTRGVGAWRCARQPESPVDDSCPLPTNPAPSSPNPASRRKARHSLSGRCPATRRAVAAVVGEGDGSK